nr:MAG TPA: hypothetical protein [Caudoviricetes sp.]
MSERRFLSACAFSRSLSAPGRRSNSFSSLAPTVRPPLLRVLEQWACVPNRHFCATRPRRSPRTTLGRGGRAGYLLTLQPEAKQKQETVPV